MLKDLGTPAKGLVSSAGLPREIRRRRAILALVILASFTLIVLDARRSAGSPVEPLRHAAAAVFGPLESAAHVRPAACGQPPGPVRRSG